MPTFIRPLFSALMLASLCTPIAFAQNDPGSIDDLLGIEFAPLQTEIQEDQQLPELEAPLIVGGRVELPPPPTLGQQATQSVLELPQITMDEPAPGALVLPDLTMPTPENTRADAFEDRTVLKPQTEALRGDRLDLVPYGNPGSNVSRIPAPRMQSPRALTYGARSLPSRSQFQAYRVPLQVEFFSVNRGFGYQPYGGYRQSSYGYRPSGGYRPYGGYGGRCPSGR